MAGEDTGRCESRREVCLRQSHGRQGDHLWHALTAETVQVREVPAQEGAHVGHLCLSFPFGLRVLPAFTARSRVDIAVVRASKKKDRIALEAHILTIADFCPNSEDSYAVALFSAQNVCHWVFDFLHRLRQFAARVNRKRKCDLTLQCLRNSQ